MTMGKVSFGGVTKRVCLAYIPEPRVGEYVVVHVGFAISRIDEERAREVFETLRELGELGELDVPQPPGPGEELPGTPGGESSVTPIGPERAEGGEP